MFLCARNFEEVDPLHGALLDVFAGKLLRAVVAQAVEAPLRHLLRRELGEAGSRLWWLD
jgi:hypothetical protein